MLDKYDHALLCKNRAPNPNKMHGLDVIEKKLILSNFFNYFTRL